jgi:hypothetical protein
MDRVRIARDDRSGRLIWGLHLRGRSGRFATGLILIGLGVVALLGQQGIIPHEFWRHGWPWIVVALAAVQLATAKTVGRLGDGVFFGLIGVWLVLVEAHWRGFTYANSWPLTLVAVGASYVVKAVAGSFLPEGPHVEVLIDHDRREGGGDA